MYVPIQTTLRGHFKTDDLADALDCDTARAVGIRVMLWTWAMDQLEDTSGVLPEMGERTWSKIFGVDPGHGIVTRDSCVTAGIIDLEKGSYIIHGWTEVAEKIRKKQKQAAARQRKHRQKGGVTRDSRSRNASVTGDRIGKDKIREDRKDSKPASSSAGVEESFQNWYSQYPRKSGPKKALAAWRKMSQAERAKALEVVPILAEIWAPIPAKKRTYCKYAATWLNQGCWEDDPEEWRAMASRSQTNQKADSQQGRNDYSWPEWKPGDPVGMIEEN